MNDNDLIDELRDGMRARTDHTEVPSGFADRARRTARRRSARRAATVGTPLLAAAGVATVLATSAGSGSSAPRRAQAPNVTVGGAQAHDTAYIIKRVKAKVADDSSGRLMYTYAVPSGAETSNGSLINLGQHSWDQYVYDTPDGDQYQRTMDYNQDGNLTDVAFWRIYTAADGKQTLAATRINPATHTYTTSQTLTGGGATRGAPIPADVAEVQQALQSGQVTQLGPVTVNGTQAIALSMKEVRVGSRLVSTQSTGWNLTLYVDAQTYQPLSLVVSSPGNNQRGLFITDYLPATPANIAKADNDSIPAGYTKVNRAN